MLNKTVTNHQTKIVNAFISLQKKQISENESWYHPEYIKGFNYFFADGPFSFEKFEQKLKDFDWKFKFVDGYISGYEYFKCLGNRILPVINKARNEDQLLYADFPDMIHDVIGHAPMIFNKDYAFFLKKIYEVISEIKLEKIDIDYLSLQGVTKEDRERNLEQLNEVEKTLENNPTLFYKINNIALWSVEFGLLKTKNSLKAYGAAVVASPLEISNLFEKEVPIKNLLNVANPSFNFSSLQDELYATNSLDDVISYMLNTKSMLNKVTKYKSFKKATSSKNAKSNVA